MAFSDRTRRQKRSVRFHCGTSMALAAHLHVFSFLFLETQGVIREVVTMLVREGTRQDFFFFFSRTLLKRCYRYIPLFALVRENLVQYQLLVYILGATFFLLFKQHKGRQQQWFSLLLLVDPFNMLSVCTNVLLCFTVCKTIS